MDKYDAPIDLIVGGHALADSDYGVPGPQQQRMRKSPFPTRHSERNAHASSEVASTIAYASARVPDEPSAETDLDSR